MAHRTAASWIAELELKPHPEGGYYRETHRSSGDIGPDSLPPAVQGRRPYMTSIYYLLQTGQVSRFHRIQSDELWFFHDGDPLEILLVDKKVSRILLGRNSAYGQSLQGIVPAQTWFGARLLPAFAGYSLVSCVVAPGFSFDDFRLAAPDDLQHWPKMRDVPELCPPLH